jgi:uncharacterized 2Fe-2S/4Fe-4S cluster protein (DUF4445 family)
MRKGKIVILFNPALKRIEVEVGSSLLDAARLAGIKIEALCGGKIKCGKCKVKISQGAESLNELTAIEKELLHGELLADGFRLSCAARVQRSERFFGSGEEKTHVVVEIAREDQERAQKILSETNEVSGTFTPLPLVRTHLVDVPEPTLEDPTPDFERLARHLKRESGLVDLDIDYDLLKKLPVIARENEWSMAVTVWNSKRILSIEKKRNGERIYGVAVDIGTSTVVGYLVDLTSGKVMATEALLNPQTSHGADVMTRMSYCIENSRGLNELHNLIIEALNDIIGKLCRKTETISKDVFEVTITGNSVMQHIFLGLSPKFIALSPYTPVIKKGINLRASEIGLKINPRANVYVFPVIAGYVGGDTIGVILSTNLYKEPELTLALDIGTNGEVVLGNNDYIEACSCAAGPALEGATLKYGMRATTGAIEKLSINDKTLDVEYETIDDALPRGICGSGVIDLIAAMLESGVISRTGAINLGLKSPRLRERDKIPEFVVEWSDKTEKGVGDIVITQKDIGEIQLAKAALYAGASVLMKRRGIEEKDIDRILLAGAFGSYTSKESSKIIGLYPDVPLNKVKTIGNGAGAGAIFSLLSGEKRKDAQMISESAHYVELTVTPGFEEELMSAMYLPHQDLRRFASVPCNPTGGEYNEH